MFYNREKELNIIRKGINSNKKTVILLYGKRRVGKSSLIREAVKDFDGIYINYTCVKSSYIGNIKLFSKSICEALEIPKVIFESLDDAFAFIQKQKKKICVVVDEYQYLKNTLKEGEVDSYFQIICDKLQNNVKLILCGSYISVMKELLKEGNPLFGRFTDIIHLEEMDYYDSSSFYTNESLDEKIIMYSIFGGSPYVLENIDYDISISDNIKQKLIYSNGIFRTHIENVMLSEIRQTFDVRILEAIGNGQVKYSEILSDLNEKDNGYLDKQIKNLIKMETISKLNPINKENDRKKIFYEINDNLMRFYFAYIFNNVSMIENIGEDRFYENVVKKSIDNYINKRFEKIVQQYFKRQVKSGKLGNVLNIGSYWYDDQKNNKNGQFDCVLQLKNGYKVYEVKRLQGKMDKKYALEEIKKINDINDLNVVSVGLVSSNGFDFIDKDIELIDGRKIYDDEEKF